MIRKKERWLDKKNNIDKLIFGVFVCCVLLLITDFFYEKHSQVFVESWFGFYCFYGFIICCVVVFGCKLMRKLLMRREDFYDN